MRAGWSARIGFAILFAQAVFAEAQEAWPDTSFSKSFQCPESLWTRWGRDRADMRFITWAMEPPREWSVDQLLAYRMELLRTHGCKETLEAIENGTIEAQVEAEVVNERRTGVVLLGAGVPVLWYLWRRRRDKAHALG